MFSLCSVYADLKSSRDKNATVVVHRRRPLRARLVGTPVFFKHMSNVC